MVMELYDEIRGGEYAISVELHYLGNNSYVGKLKSSKKAKRYIEKLPEIVELLKRLSDTNNPSLLLALSCRAEEIITYAEGKP